MNNHRTRVGSPRIGSSSFSLLFFSLAAVTLTTPPTMKSDARCSDECGDFLGGFHSWPSTNGGVVRCPVRTLNGLKKEWHTYYLKQKSWICHHQVEKHAHTNHAPCEELPTALLKKGKLKHQNWLFLTTCIIVGFEHKCTTHHRLWGMVDGWGVSLNVLVPFL